MLRKCVLTKYDDESESATTSTDNLYCYKQTDTHTVLKLWGGDREKNVQIGHDETLPTMTVSTPQLFSRFPLKPTGFLSLSCLSGLPDRFFTQKMTKII